MHCNILNDLSDRVCLRNKTEDSSKSSSNVITGINESKTFIKYIYHANVNIRLMVKNMIQIKFGITINLGVRAKIWKNIMYARGHPLSTYAKFSEKLTFLTPWYAHVCVRIRGLEMLVFRKIWCTYLMDDPLKRLYLESCYMKLWKWQIFRKYYWRFSNYMWWNYKRCR